MKAVVAYIQEHYAEGISLDELAKLMGSSVSQFKRIFTKTLEMSPGRYIVNTRINAKTQILTSPPNPPRPSNGQITD